VQHTPVCGTPRFAAHFGLQHTSACSTSRFDLTYICAKFSFTMAKPVLFLLGLFLFFACPERNIVLVNEIKTLDAKWVRLTEQVAGLSKMLPRWKAQTEDALSVIREMEASSAEWKDSVTAIQSGTVRQLSKVLEKFETYRLHFDESLSQFTQWQQEALKQSGENSESIRNDLVKFQESYNQERQKLEEIQQQVYSLVETHNNLRKQLMAETEWIQYDAISLR
jgi:chromosome segregation ATPase